MTARETVHEVETTATVTLELPRERGGELRSVATEHLESIAAIRSAAVAEQRGVEAAEEHLRVTVVANLTLHFTAAEAAADAGTIRDQLAGEVAALEEFEVLAGPYEIETW